MIYVHNKRNTTYRGPSEYIGRPSILGNPYSLKQYDRVESIRLYREWLWDKYWIEQDQQVINELYRLVEIARHGDLHLICWCSPLPCHGDVIREAINSILGIGRWIK